MSSPRIRMTPRPEPTPKGKPPRYKKCPPWVPEDLRAEFFEILWLNHGDEFAACAHVRRLKAEAAK